MTAQHFALATIALLAHFHFAQGQVRPEKDYPGVFHAVQMAEVFADSKTFVDCTPTLAPELLRERFRSEKPEGKKALRKFVEQYFEMPPALPVKVQPQEKATVAGHIEQLWDVLKRTDGRQNPLSTRIALPKPYVVPGGRFREVFYWDSYFTMLGLQISGRDSLVRGMAENFAWLIDTYGHIPNGNRTYFLSRSQPPFFAPMLDILADIEDNTVYQEFLPQLEKEYAFWMEGKAKLTAQNPAYKRVVRLPDGNVLNRYWDKQAQPRPESYREDVHLAQLADRDPEQLYRDLRAACESGWDFSSRWLADGRSLASIQTTAYLPVDLNTLLFHLERTLAKTYALGGNHRKGLAYKRAADLRQQAIDHYCFDENTGFYMDYLYKAQRTSDVLSLAGMYPLFFRLSGKTRAARVQQTLGQFMLFPGGWVSTLRLTQQQWDTPNGWAPLQWITIQGLRNYGYHALARVSAENWLKTNEKVFENTGKMMEKYNVVSLGIENGGGEYPTQDGFGWTNGVYLKLKNMAWE